VLELKEVVHFQEDMRKPAPVKPMHPQEPLQDISKQVCQVGNKMLSHVGQLHPPELLPVIQWSGKLRKPLPEVLKALQEVVPFLLQEVNRLPKCAANSLRRPDVSKCLLQEASKRLPLEGQLSSPQQQEAR
jgi:hypothetical protein